MTNRPNSAVAPDLEGLPLRQALAEQRREIGRELHDNLGQQLTGLGLLAKGISESIPDSRIEVREELNALVAGLRDALADLRRLSHGLVQSPAQMTGLAESLRQIVTATGQASAAQCSFEREGGAEVEDPVAARNLCRIAQEAVQNAIRHADSESIRVVLCRDDDAVTLEIRDDGRGVDVASEIGGIGMENMRERAQKIGAELDVLSGIEAGTVVRCSLPEGVA